MTTNFSQTAAYIWSLADLLRGDFKQSQYGRVILPFTILRRLECVLEKTKPQVLAEAEKLEAMDKLKEEAREKFLLKAAGESFCNTSPMNLSTLGKEDAKSNLLTYVDSFSRDACEIFEHFQFEKFVALLDEANLLYQIALKVATMDLGPQAINNREMGLVFEELIRRFAESSNETAGEHFTPRDIVRLTTSLVFAEDDEALTEEGVIRTIYDPTAGTGGFLSCGMEYVRELNPNAVIRAFGQELNSEGYAVCKGDMLIKGQDVDQIKLGNTLSEDQLQEHKFDYMLCNPPFGVDWKKVESEIKHEHRVKGFDGRFGPGLPRVSDGSLLFLMHLLDKMRPFHPKDPDQPGGRIGIVLNGSPLFTGEAGRGESEIRRHILEKDLLEAIVALPTDMFYNTGIATYVWILSNKKDEERKGKVQLINGVHLYRKMRKSLGSKQQELGPDDIALITQTFGKFEPVESYNLDKETEPKSNRGRSATTKKKAEKRTFACKIFDSHEFGYRRITVERPLRLSVQFTDERVARLRFAAGTLNAQKQLLEKAVALQKAVGAGQTDDFNEFEDTLKQALKSGGVKLEAKEKKQLLDAVAWTNPDAEPVVLKKLKTAADPMYGAFEYRGAVVQFKPDGSLRDNEDVPLTAETAKGENVNAVNEAYFKKEVAPHVKDAWIDAGKRDAKDNRVGIVGYEIPFNRHFYQYEPPRDLAEIDADLDKLSAEIMEMLGLYR